MNTQLKPALGTLHLWGIAVGLVISGEYFGWSYGWGTAGTLGFLVTALMVATMYTCFIFSFTELTTAIPHAGGPFAYSRRAFGEKGGLIAGIATLIEFVFALYLLIRFATISQFKYVPMAIALLFDLRDLYNLPETEQEANIPVHSNTPPEWSGTDRLIHHCTFLI